MLRLTGEKIEAMLSHVISYVGFTGEITSNKEIPVIVVLSVTWEFNEVIYSTVIAL